MVRSEKEFFSEGAAQEKVTKAEGLWDQNKGNRGRAGYRGGKHRTPTPRRSSGKRKWSQSRETSSEADREMGF